MAVHMRVNVDRREYREYVMLSVKLHFVDF